MKECKVVQDLLPNYIENLTNEETNKFIEEHLKKCEQCKKIHNNMKKDLNVENTTKKKKEVKFLKKYRNKLRVLEIMLLIIVVAFAINTGRKMYIIKDLNNKSKEYVNSKNYHTITYSLDNGNYTKSEVFSLGDKKKLIITTMTEDARKQVVTIYATKIGTVPDTEYAKTYPPTEIYKQNMYKETETEKTAMLDLEIGMSVDVQEAFWGVDNTKDLIITAITSSIKKVTFNGEECYYASGTQNIFPNAGMYVNKDTGLKVATMASEYENPDGEKGRIAGAEYKYEFGTVTENDFVEPDISNYTIQNPNNNISK